MLNTGILLSGILLAGGQSRRMGVPKALLDLEGKKLYRYGLELLAGFCDEIFISAPKGLISHDKYPVIPDTFAGKGPLGGIWSCMQKATHDYCLVLSCDMPFMEAGLIRIVIRILIRESNKDYCLFSNEFNQPEPLAGIYSVRLLPLMKEMLDRKDHKIQNLIFRSEGITLQPLKYSPESKRAFFNINTPADLEKAREWIRQTKD